MDIEILKILKSMQSDMQLMKSNIRQIHERIERVDKKTDKNTLLLEDLNKAVTDTSSRGRDMQKDLTRVIRAAGENQAEITELKDAK